MAINSGRMRFRLELLKPKLGADGEPERNEFGEESGDLELVQRPWCDIIETENSEDESTSIVDQSQITFVVRYSRMYDNASNNMVIRFDGDLYDITSADDPEKRRKMITILAIKRR